jgi:hypothetical protein
VDSERDELLPVAEHFELAALDKRDGDFFEWIVGSERNAPLGPVACSDKDTAVFLEPLPCQVLDSLGSTLVEDVDVEGGR